MERFSGVAGREYSGSPDAGQSRAGLSAGLNRFIWDMRYPSVSSIPGLPPVVINPIARPGTYQVRLTVDGESQTQSFEMKINPNETYSRAETDAKAEAWMTVHEKAEDGVQAVLRAQAAREKMSGAAEGSGQTAEQAKKIVELCTDLESGMVATGTTLVQIISEPSKPLAILTMLHNIMESGEGPPNRPWLEVYEKVAGEMDAKIAEFDAALAKEMAKYDEMAR